MMTTTEQRIRAHITVREENIRKTQPKMKAPSTEPADEIPMDSTPPINEPNQKPISPAKPSETTSQTKPTSKKGGKLLFASLVAMGIGWTLAYVVFFR